MTDRPFRVLSVRGEHVELAREETEQAAQQRGTTGVGRERRCEPASSGTPPLQCTQSDGNVRLSENKGKMKQEAEAGHHLILIIQSPFGRSQ